MSGAALDIRWRAHLAAPPERVYAALATAQGRSSFWAETAEEESGVVHFRFSGALELHSRVLAADRPHHYAVEYFDGSRVDFRLEDDGAGGTDLALTETGLPAKNHAEHRPGWVAVLLALKAYVDFGVDLRNHDDRRAWKDGYVDT